MSDLFTIDASGIWFNVGYYKDKVIDEYESLIWVERFIEPGDFTLVVEPTEENIALLTRGTMLGHNDSRVPMLVDTRELKEGKLKVTGKTLEVFFDERYAGLSGTQDEGTPAEQFTLVIDRMQDGTLMGADVYMVFGPIPALITGEMDDGGADKSEFRELHFWDPAYSILLDLAKKHNVDINVFRVPRGIGGHAYDLVFSIYSGQDLTTEQEVNQPIRFSEHLDNYANPSELRSEVGSKTHVIVFPPTTTAAGVIPPIVMSVDDLDFDFESTPFEWRWGVVQPTSTQITNQEINPTGNTWTLSQKKAKLRRMCKALGAKYLRDHRPTAVVDGEVPDDARYRYYSEPNPEGYPTYRLGDTVEIQGHYGGVRKGVVTEFIRSQDASGKRAYPTIKSGAAIRTTSTHPEEKTIVVESHIAVGDYWAAGTYPTVPAVWNADAGVQKVEGFQNLNQPDPGLDNFRFRWGIGSGVSSDYVQFNAPDPKPAGAEEIQVNIVSRLIEGVWYIGFVWRSTTGTWFGTWRPDDMVWHEQTDPGDPLADTSWLMPMPSGWDTNGWAAVTQIMSVAD